MAQAKMQWEKEKLTFSKLSNSHSNLDGSNYNAGQFSNFALEVTVFYDLFIEILDFFI